MKNKFIFLLIVLVFCSALVQCSKKIDAGSPPVNNINYRILTDAEVNSLQAAGMDTLPIENMIRAVNNNDYPNIHSVLIARNKKLIFERYFAGKDENFGVNLGIVNHTKETLHDIRSISKSVTSACIGLAFSQGLLTNVDQNIFDFFPDYNIYNTGSKSQITIKHLLTMTTGMEWDESMSYTDPLNAEIQMTNATDPVEFVLSRPMIAPPGQLFNYNGGATHLLAAIIKKVSGKEINDFAKEFLFTPLGINHFVWNKYSKSGQPAAASGLRLRSGDLMNFGLLYADGGRWMNTQVIPTSWTNETFESHINRPAGAYGYQFFIMPHFTSSGRTIKLVAAIGNGDQRIFIDHENDLVVVVTAGNYNKALAKNAMALTRDFIHPSIF